MGRAHLLVVAAILTLAACALAQSVVSTILQDSANTVTYATWLSTEIGLATPEQAVLRAFAASTANLTIVSREYSILATNPRAVRSAALFAPWLQASFAFDAASPYFVNLNASVNEGALWANLTALWAAHNLTAILPNSIARRCRDLSGVPRLVPRFVNVHAFFYRMSEFTAMGLSPPSTIDELTAICDAYAALGRKCFAMNVVRSLDSVLLLFDTVLSRLTNGSFVTAFHAGDVPFTDPNILAVGDELAVLRARGMLDVYGKAVGTPAGWKSSAEDFRDRRAGLFLGYDTVRTSIVNVTDREDMRTFMWPNMGSVPRPITAAIATTVFTGVPANALNHAGGLALVDFLVRPEAIALMLNVSLRVGVPVVAKPESFERYQTDPLLRQLVEFVRTTEELISETTSSLALAGTLAEFRSTSESALAAWILGSPTTPLVQMRADYAALMGSLEELRFAERYQAVSRPTPSLPSGTYEIAFGTAVVISFKVHPSDATVFVAVNSETFWPAASVRLANVGTYVVRAYASKDLWRNSAVFGGEYNVTTPLVSSPAESASSPSVLVRSSNTLPIVLGSLAAALVCTVVVFFLLYRCWSARIERMDVFSSMLLLASEIGIKHRLARGASATVYRGEFRGVPVAVKVIGNELSPELCLESEHPVVGLLAPTVLPSGALRLRMAHARRPPCARWRRGRRAGVVPSDAREPVVTDDLGALSNSLGGDSLGDGGTQLSSETRLAAKSMLDTLDANDRGASLTATAGSDRLAGLRAFVDEVSMLVSLRQPNIVTCMGFTLFPRFAIVTELLERGSLFDVIGAAANLETPAPSAVMCALWALHVARGLAFLHASNIVHSDLKSPNVLISSEGVAKICDFGISLRSAARVGLTTPKTGRRKFRGTFLWAAPEMLAGSAPSTASDVYALGMVLWELFAVRRLFRSTHFAAVIVGVTNGTLRPELGEVAGVHELFASSWLPQLWAHEAIARPTSASIVPYIEAHVKRLVADDGQGSGVRMAASGVFDEFHSTSSLPGSVGDRSHSEQYVPPKALCDTNNVVAWASSAPGAQLLALPQRFLEPTSTPSHRRALASLGTAWAGDATRPVQSLPDRKLSGGHVRSDSGATSVTGVLDASLVDSVNVAGSLAASSGADSSLAASDARTQPGRTHVRPGQAAVASVDSARVASQAAAGVWGPSRQPSRVNAPSLQVDVGEEGSSTTPSDV